MNNIRRTVLKGFAGAGLGLSGLINSKALLANEVGNNSAATTADFNKLFLVSSEAGEYVSGSFLAGIRSVGKDDYLRISLDDLQAFSQELKASRGATTGVETPLAIIGLVDHATSVVLLDILRSAGATHKYAVSLNLPEDKQAAKYVWALGQDLAGANGSFNLQQFSGSGNSYSWLLFHSVI